MNLSYNEIHSILLEEHRKLWKHRNLIEELEDCGYLGKINSENQRLDEIMIQIDGAIKRRCETVNAEVLMQPSHIELS